MSQPSAEPPTGASLGHSQALVEATQPDAHLPAQSSPKRKSDSFEPVSSSQPGVEDSQQQRAEEEDRPITQKSPSEMRQAAKDKVAKKARTQMLEVKRRLNDALEPLKKLAKELEEEGGGGSLIVDPMLRKNMKAHLAEKILECWIMFDEDLPLGDLISWSVAVKQMKLAHKLVVSAINKDCEQLGMRPLWETEEVVLE